MLHTAVKCPKCQSTLESLGGRTKDGTVIEADIDLSQCIPPDGIIGVCQACGEIFSASLVTKSLTEKDLLVVPEAALLALRLAQRRVLAKDKSQPEVNSGFNIRSVCSSDVDASQNIPNN